MPDENKWQREVLEKLALSALQEQRRARHWGIFFKLLTFIFLFTVLYFTLSGSGEFAAPLGKHTALIELKGVISADSPASAEQIDSSLEEAFKDKNTRGVILRINSPGGSPVQAGEINDQIGKLRREHPDIPVYAVVEEMCASGAYYVAAAADKIYVDKASIVGSIGVLMDGFGFTGTMEKLGVERRLLTAGENKGFLDPFSPSSDKQKKYAQSMLDEIHAQFISVVRKGRGNRLKETPDMFSGLVWTGQKSIELGLADSLGDIDYVAREVVHAEDIVDYTPRQTLGERVAKQIGASFLGGAMQALGFKGSIR